MVDVTVKLPSQFKKDEIFSLEMSKSNIAIISKLVANLQKLVKEEEDEKKIANDLDNVSKNSTKTLENQHETKKDTAVIIDKTLFNVKTKNDNNNDNKIEIIPSTLTTSSDNNNNNDNNIDILAPPAPEAMKNNTINPPNIVSQQVTVDGVLLDYLTNHLQFKETVATKALSICMTTNTTTIIILITTTTTTMIVYRQINHQHLQNVKVCCKKF